MSNLLSYSELLNAKIDPAEFLLACSEASLGDFELARLNCMANLRKQIRVLEAELLRLEAEALVARWLIEHRRELAQLDRKHALQKTLQFPNGSFV